MSFFMFRPDPKCQCLSKFAGRSLNVIYEHHDCWSTSWFPQNLISLNTWRFHFVIRSHSLTASPIHFFLIFSWPRSFSLQCFCKTYFLSIIPSYYYIISFSTVDSIFNPLFLSVPAVSSSLFILPFFFLFVRIHTHLYSTVPIFRLYRLYPLTQPFY